MDIQSNLSDNNLPYTSFLHGGLNIEKFSSAPTDDLKSWISEGSLSDQEKRAVRAELIRRENEATSSSTEDKDVSNESSHESQILKLTDAAISEGKNAKRPGIGESA